MLHQFRCLGLFKLFIINIFLLSCCSFVLASNKIIKPVPEIKGVFLGKTFLFETKHDFKRIVVGDARIANVRAISTRQLLIKGLNPGWTNLIIWYNDKIPPQFYDFKVKIDPKMIAEVETLIKKLVPASRVRLIPANQELLLEGEVYSLEDMHRVLQIATAFFSSKKKKKGTKAEEGQSSTTINIGTDKSGSDSIEGGSQLEDNLDMTVAVKNNLIILKGCQQVQLEVKIAEVSRSNMKKMGLSFLNNENWSIGVFPTGNASGKMTNEPVRAIRTITSGGIIDQESGGSFIESATEIASPFGAAFQVLLHSSKNNSLAMLSILKGQGLAKLLATPTLVTMSGQTASFNVGGEFPVPTTDSVGSTSISYKEYGILLKFTPTVTDKETIILKVSPEVSSVDWSLGTASGGVAVPGLKSRTAHATLQLKDGQTFVMAGLLKEESHVVTSKIPFLGDLPVFGVLFTSREVEKNETELVIIVTPRLVQPLNKSELVSLPGENLINSVSDFEFFFLNKTGKETGFKDRDKKSTPKFTGEIGFEQ